MKDPYDEPSVIERLEAFRGSRRIGERVSGPLARCAFIGIVTLFLLMPLGFVQDIVYERMHLYQAASDNITRSWGGPQTISGPLLIIPYQIWKDRKEYVDVKNGDWIEKKEVVTREYFTRYKVVLPSALSFNATLDPEVRYRGIYRQALYNAPVAVNGSFLLPAANEFAANMSEIFWGDAWISVGITDLKTISDAAPATWENTTLPAYKPGADAQDLLGAGFHTAVALAETDAGAKRNFSMQLRVRGSGGISFTPVGERTEISMTGTWPAPSFQGNLLPVERTISDNGFTATWRISNLTRTYPQIADIDSAAFRTKNKESGITQFTAGVDLHEPVSLYRMVRRSVAYGILFIAVTFVALFAFEMVSKQRMALVQYTMVGISMCLFYLSLLSLAEHVDFIIAFVASSAITIIMNSLYVAAALGSKNKGCLLAALLTALYAVLFSLLRMEDFSLLMGTGLLLAMMGALMYVTRKLPVRGSAAPESGAE